MASPPANLTISNSTLPLFHTCPPGLGDASCATAACGSTFVSPGRRPLKADNVSACTNCDEGFTGLNCNLCTSSYSCESLRVKLGVGTGGSSTSHAAGAPFGVTQNNTLTCYNQPKAFTTTYVQCDIEQPTLSSLIPGRFVFAGIKVAQPDAFNTTGLAAWPSSPGTSYSAIFLDGKEQFRCQASQCSSSNLTTAVDPAATPPPGLKKAVTEEWRCEELQCECLPDSRFCSGGGVLNLQGLLEGLKGPLTLPCDYVGPDGTSSCAFRSPSFEQFLGAQGLPLKQCRFGSCLSQQDLDTGMAREADAVQTAKGSSLSGGVIAGLVVLALSVAALISSVGVGTLLRRRAAARPRQPDTAAVGMAWSNLHYSVAAQTVSPGWRNGRNTLESLRSSCEVDDKSATRADLSSSQLRALEERSNDPGSGTPRPPPSSGRGVGQQQILDGISGQCRPGTFVALLGPSGSGKTTLLELLAGKDKTGRKTGEVSLQCADGPFQPPAAADRRLVAFVDQDDHLPALSTPREALRFACKLANAENVPRRERDAIVDRVLEALHLVHVADKPIGGGATVGRSGSNHGSGGGLGSLFGLGSGAQRGLSGGERRRVSIGLAMVCRPKILLLDEPLSGLDMTAALKVMRLLRQLACGAACNGTTILMTLHQPSSEIFHLVDGVLLLSGGRLLYDGTPQDALQWCADQGRAVGAGYNVADLLLEIAYEPESVEASRGQRVGGNGVGGAGAQSLRSDTPSHLPQDDTARLLQHSKSAGNGGERTAAAESAPQGLDSLAKQTDWRRLAGYSDRPLATFLSQFEALGSRALQTARRDATGPLAHLVGALITGLVVGGAFFKVKLSIGGFQNRVGSMYFLLILLTFLGMPSAVSLDRARPLMVRERSQALYSPLAWLAAHVVYDLAVLRILPTVILCESVYWMVGLRASASTHFQFLLMACLYAAVCAVCNMLLAALCADLSVAVLLSGLFVIFNIGFGGFLLNLDSLPGVLRWIRWVCPLRYALEGVASNELRGLEVVDNLNGVPIRAPVSLIAPKLFGFEPEYYRNLLILALGYLLGLGLLLSGAVWWRVKERR